MTPCSVASRLLLTTCAVCVAAAAVFGEPQNPDPGQVVPPVERLGPNQLRIGHVSVDVDAREVAVTGRVNDVQWLEWVANTTGGLKAYESAITADTNAITFNTALLLIGLDKAHARVPIRHFDAEPPRGDAVELWVEWGEASPRKRVRVEQLLLDKRTNSTLPEGPWVYTGSSFYPNNGGYIAELDGVLIGFVHSPAPIIENPGAGAVDAFGSMVLNKELIAPGTPVTLIVKAVAPVAKR